MNLDKDLPELGKLIKSYMVNIEPEMTQKELAKEIEKSESYISRIINGDSNAPRPILLRLINFFFDRKVLVTIENANELLKAADEQPLQDRIPSEKEIIRKLSNSSATEAKDEPKKEIPPQVIELIERILKGLDLQELNKYIPEDLPEAERLILSLASLAIAGIMGIFTIVLIFLTPFMPDEAVPFLIAFFSGLYGKKEIVKYSSEKNLDNCDNPDPKAENNE